MRTVMPKALLISLLAGAGAVHADNVTTNDYLSTSTEADMRESCKDLDLDTSGNVSGVCNPSTTRSSVALESYARCKGGKLEWGTGGFMSTLSGADIEVSSDGQAYLLAGTCTSATGATDTEKDTLQLDDRMYNDKGKLAYSAEG